MVAAQRHTVLDYSKFDDIDCSDEEDSAAQTPGPNKKLAEALTNIMSQDGDMDKANQLAQEVMAERGTSMEQVQENYIKFLEDSGMQSEEIHKTLENDNPQEVLDKMRDVSLAKQAADKEETPTYSIDEEHDCGRCSSLVICIDLPKLDSLAEADLELAGTRLHLHAPGIYKLKMELPHPIDEDLAKAKFSAKTHRLKITAPVVEEVLR